MKKMILLLAAVVALGMQSSCAKHGEKAANGQEYTCSMHPQVRSDKPGDCPLCGMKLIPVPRVEAAPASGPGEEAPGQPTEKPGVNEVRLMPAQDAILSVDLAEVESRPLNKQVEAFGEVSYILDGVFHYAWFYSGRIEKVFIDYNTTRVEKGESLMEIYSPEAIADQEAYLRTARERWLRTFYERKALTAEMEAIAARLERVGMDADALKDLLKSGKVRSRFVIHAPATGTLIGERHHVGEQFEAKDALFLLAPLDKVWFVAQFYEQDLSLLKLGGKAEIVLKSQPGKRYEGEIVYIDREIHPEARTVKARFEVANPKWELLPLASGVAKLDVPLSTEALSIPVSAVLDTGMRKIVYVAKGAGRYEPREIKTGLASEDRVEILEGLQAGEKIVRSGQFLLDAEAEIRGSGSSLPAQGNLPASSSTPVHQH
jgi:Cu(I)/Ag(I) efflux system membrane fusion protein